MITDGDGEGNKNKTPRMPTRNLQQAITREMKRHVRNTLSHAILDLKKNLFESKGSIKGSLHMISKDTKGAKKYYWGTMVENILYIIFFKPQGP